MSCTLSLIYQLSRGVLCAVIVGGAVRVGVGFRPVRRGGSLGSYEPPSSTCGKQKSEPNHFVAVQDLIEGSQLEASLKRLEVPSYALYTPHRPPFCYDVIGRLRPCCDNEAQQPLD